MYVIYNASEIVNELVKEWVTSFKIPNWCRNMNQRE